MSPRLLADQPLASGTASIATDHLGIGPSLVDKDQLLGIKACLADPPLLTRLSNVGPILFGGVQAFLRNGHAGGGPTGWSTKPKAFARRCRLSITRSRYRVS